MCTEACKCKSLIQQTLCPIFTMNTPDGMFYARLLFLQVDSFISCQSNVLANSHKKNSFSMTMCE